MCIYWKDQGFAEEDGAALAFHRLDVSLLVSRSWGAFGESLAAAGYNGPQRYPGQPHAYRLTGVVVYFWHASTLLRALAESLCFPWDVIIPRSLMGPLFDSYNIPSLLSRKQW